MSRPDGLAERIGRWLPALLGFSLVAAALLSDRILPGGQPGLGRTQMLAVLFGSALGLTGLVLNVGSLGRSLIAPAYAIGLAILAASTGILPGGMPFRVVGGAIALAGLAIDSAGYRRLMAEWRAAGVLRGMNLAWALIALAQVGLVVLVVRQYHLESQAFFDSTLLIAATGFAVGFLVPPGLRLLYFLALSLAGFGAVLGWTNLAWLLAASTPILVIAHLPISFRLRVWMLIALTVALAVCRVGPAHVILPGAVWPILGTIFMFRLIVYLYDLSHAKEKVSWTRTLAYFFMLPNVVFPFFPVVDSTVFKRTWYDAESRAIHQSGLVFLFWGIVHLILYRVVSYYLLISPEQVHTIPQLARYVVTNFLLYLRVSGQFHLIIGMLHLFGFDLPRANNRYFFASSFTDLWRRINIYWKEFMLKVFYYPIVFKLKKLGETRSMILATLAVFVITWFFHAWQWFWLRGSFLVSLPDILFWAILGVLVVVNSLIELKRGRRRELTKKERSPAEWAGLTLRTAGTFSAMAILWSLWSSRSLGEWFTLWSVVPHALFSAAGIGATLLLGMALAGDKAPGGKGAPAPAAPGSRLAAAKASARTAARPPRLGWTAASVGAGLLLLWVGGNAKVASRYGPEFEKVMRDLRWGRLTAEDQNQLERGYYENLNAVNSFNGDLWKLYMRRPVYQEIWETDAVRKTGDYMDTELNPNISIIFRGAPYTTNRWGMRDQDYEKVAAPGTLRIALLGDSHTEGWGVGNHENFDARLEAKLNAEHPIPGVAKYELLNFAVGGYLPLQVLMSLERKGLDFHPDVVFFVAHPGDAERMQYQLARGVVRRYANPFPELEAMTKEAGITPEMTERDAAARMAPYGERSLAWVYRRLATDCAKNGIRPVWIIMPAVPGREEHEQRDRMVAMAHDAGLTVWDLTDVYAAYDLDQVRVAEWDQHPSPFAHGLIADRLFADMMANREIFAPRGR